MDPHYDPDKIESEAQNYWEDNETFRAVEDPAREKFYCLSMFPYPSGRLHMGHVRNYTIGDVIARYQRLRGKNVLQPMGWDAFGLPAENAAIKHATPPARWTYTNIEYMKAQLKSLGFGYDWSRELATCDPDYYRWEQWLFTRMVDKGLAYRKKATVNWDPVDRTVLANEQVIDGKGWRSGAPVEKREIEQWFVRITEYAQALLDDLDQLEGWPEQVRTMQRNWIGRSEGAELDFEVPESGERLTVFTTRPDTLMGVTYVAVAAEHPLALRVAEHDTAVAEFVAQCRHGGVSEAELETMEKLGLALGIDVIHPVSGDRVPVWVANFVLMSYGTGAVMAVPAHDQRDWEFATKYGIPKRQVIFPADGSQQGIEEGAYVEKGILRHSGPFDGLSFEEAFEAIAEYLSQVGKGARRINFRLRDWGVSRQRYWGCPIPVVYAPDGEVRTVPVEELPVELPPDVIVDGHGSPLTRMPEFYELQGGATRETDTFDTFFESSWYYARYCSADCDTAMLDERARYWLPVDQYVGGIEHAVLHLLYARFFHKLMRDEDLVEGDEPFTRLLTQGMVVAETYYREDTQGHRQWFNPADVEVTRDEKGRILRAVLLGDGQDVTPGGVEKMSKSKNNGVDPQALIDRYGADTVRLYTMFTSPPDQALEWSDEGVEGAYRFLRRLWTLATERGEALRGAASDPGALDESARQARREIHAALRKALYDYERHQFNTVVSACMTMVNQLYKLDDSASAGAVLEEGLSIVLRLLAPIAPHVTHHLWRELGFGPDILAGGWPEPDEAALEQDRIELVVQVNGKLRGKVQVAADADEAGCREAALANDNVARFIAGKPVRKVIVVSGRLINIVV
jgi:leucyl-tRNA synthetase